MPRWEFASDMTWKNLWNRLVTVEEEIRFLTEQGLKGKPLEEAQARLAAVRRDLLEREAILRDWGLG